METNINEGPWLLRDDSPAYEIRSIQYMWDPQPDITAYELALCMPAMVINDEELVAKLPDCARRHWVEIGWEH